MKQRRRAKRLKLAASKHPAMANSAWSSRVVFVHSDIMLDLLATPQDLQDRADRMAEMMGRGIPVDRRGNALDPKRFGVLSIG